MSLIITTVATCTAGVCLAFTLIAHCTRPRKTRVISEAERENRERRGRIMAYEGKYFDVLAAAKKECGDEELSADDLALIAEKSIEEETPVGVVRMAYDVDTETFTYHTDARNVSYKVLDAVARSFCLSHNCPQLCVHYYDEFTRAKAKAVRERREAEQQADEEKEAREAETSDDGEGRQSEESTVFAKFKNYNARASKPVKERARILTENANRFAFRGRLSEREEKLELDSQRAKADHPDLDFAAFKEMGKAKGD